MQVTSLLLLALFVLLLSPLAQLKRAGQGGGLKGARHGLRKDKVRGGGRHSRAGPSIDLAAGCSESTDSGDLFIDCQNRRLTSIPAPNIWSQNPNHLLLARNRIRVLRNRVFSGFPGLVSLDLQQNRISVVEEGAFLGLTRLTTLLLQHNQLSTLNEEALIPMPNLRYLRLYDNPWSCRCPLDSLIRTLQVPSNRNLGNHARCEEPISLKDRKLKQVTPELLCLDHGPTIDPTGDGSEKKPEKEPSDTQKPSSIRLSDVTTFCHTYMFPKPWLDCKGRGLRMVPTGIPDDIVHIDLSHNSIHHLRARDFLEAKSLRTLNLSNNHMEQIDTDSFSGLLHLRVLDMSDNSLHFVQYGVLEDLYFLSNLKLGGNPWVCDYSIHYIVYWLHLHRGVRHSGLVCHSPPEHADESVEDYVHSYNRECPKDKQRGQTDPELWNTPMEVQAELEEEEVEPGHFSELQKYQIIRLT